jgi:histidyl-tRNA synthetase
VGDEEIQNERYVLKNLSTGEQKNLSVLEILELLSNGSN